MTERQCWAYGPNGRCHHPAGHPGDHLIEITWTDEECTVPTLGHPQHAKAETVISPAAIQHVAPVVQELVQESEEAEACVACNHFHKSAACKCGCYAHI